LPLPPPPPLPFRRLAPLDPPPFFAWLNLKLPPDDLCAEVTFKPKTEFSLVSVVVSVVGVYSLLYVVKVIG